MSCMFVDCLLAGTRWNSFYLVSARACLFRTVFPSITRSSSCTHNIRYMSYRLVDYLLAGTRWNSFHLVPASMQSTNLYDIHLMLCVQSWTPDDGQKHVDWKHRETLSQRHSIPPQMTRTFSNTAVDTSNLAIIYFVSLQDLSCLPGVKWPRREAYLSDPSSTRSRMSASVPLFLLWAFM
jgi:hypothetical protein